MQRRRKKKASAAGKRPGGPGVKYDKSLPSLPPSMEERQSLDEVAGEAYAEVAGTARPGAAGTGVRSESSPSRPEVTGKAISIAAN